VATALGPPDPATDDELLARLAPGQPDTSTLRALELLGDRWKTWPQADEALRHLASQGGPVVRLFAAQALGLSLQPPEELAPALEVLQQPALYPNSILNALRTVAPHVQDPEVAEPAVGCANWMAKRVSNLAAIREVESSKHPGRVFPWEFGFGHRWRPLSKRPPHRTVKVNDVLPDDERWTYLCDLVVAAEVLGRAPGSKARRALIRLLMLAPPAVAKAAHAALVQRDDPGLARALRSILESGSAPYRAEPKVERVLRALPNGAEEWERWEEWKALAEAEDWDESEDS